MLPIFLLICSIALPVIIVIAVLWIIIFPKFYARLIRNSVKKYIREGKSNDFIGRQKLTLKDDCIEEISNTTTSRTKYSAVERIEYDKNCIYIYIGALKAILIPLSAFLDLEQKNKFMDFLKQKTGEI